MNSRELMSAAMRRQPTERIPVMPQITNDMPVRAFAALDGISNSKYGLVESDCCAIRS